MTLQGVFLAMGIVAGGILALTTYYWICIAMTRLWIMPSHLLQNSNRQDSNMARNTKITIYITKSQHMLLQSMAQKILKDDFEGEYYETESVSAVAQRLVDEALAGKETPGQAHYRVYYHAKDVPSWEELTEPQRAAFETVAKLGIKP